MDRLEQYAELAVKFGINLQKGQTLIVNAPVVACEFARLIVRKAYENGARQVIVEFSDDEINHDRLQFVSDEVISQYPKWRVDGLMTYIREGASVLNIVSTHPTIMGDIAPERLALNNRIHSENLKEYREYVMGSKVSWTIVAYPNLAWASQVFPNLAPQAAFDALMENILKATRLKEADPLKAWENHVAQLHDKLAYLNRHAFQSLHFKGPGTDLRVDLPVGHIWCGAGATTEKGIAFRPNLPTEEVFTVPHKYGVNGVLRSTKPLIYLGNMIDDFTLVFEKGKVISYSAAVGQAVLKGLLETDEGASYLGEVALVPHDSPISNTNLVFRNTLFDENASCHFALGTAYMDCYNEPHIQGAEKDARGINHSMVHVDFMVGGPEMEVTGYRDGGEWVTLFKAGNWV